MCTAPSAPKVAAPAERPAALIERLTLPGSAQRPPTTSETGVHSIEHEDNRQARLLAACLYRFDELASML